MKPSRDLIHMIGRVMRGWVLNSITSLEEINGAREYKYF